MVQRYDRKLTNRSCDVFAYYNLFVCAKHGKAVRPNCKRPVEHCWNVQLLPTTGYDRRVTLDHGVGSTRTRYKQVLLAFLGVTVFGLQISSVPLGLVAMTDTRDNTTCRYPAQNYTLGQKGIMAGMMGYGNSIGNVMLGMMAHKFNIINMLPVASGFFSGAMALAVPMAAIYVGFEAACLAILLQGLGLSFIYPCVYVHLSKWVVPHEQGKFSWVWSGHQVGHLIVMLWSGMLYASPGGWPSVYYTPGLVGIIWGIAFCTWGATSPVHHRSISLSEKEFIESLLMKSRTKDSLGNRVPQRVSIQHDFVPWKDITSSIPMWALLIVQISDLWVNECMMGPIFLHSVCNVSVMKVGLMTATAYFANIICGLVFAYLAHRTDKIGLNFSRKFWTAVGLYGGSVALLLQTLVGRHCRLACLFLEARIVINSATHPGYMSTILNVAPHLAATIASTFNALASFLASTGPLYTGFIVKDEHDLFEWDIVFWTAIAVYIVGCSTFIICGSTETQDWDSPYVTTNWGRMSPSSFNEELFPKPKKRKLHKIRMFGKMKSVQVMKHPAWNARSRIAEK